jgi:hypothetical protein
MRVTCIVVPPIPQTHVIVVVDWTVDVGSTVGIAQLLQHSGLVVGRFAKDTHIVPGLFHQAPHSRHVGTGNSSVGVHARTIHVSGWPNIVEITTRKKFSAGGTTNGGVDHKILHHGTLG